MHHRAESLSAGAMWEFIGQGLFPCNGCLQASIRFYGTPLFARRVFRCGTLEEFPMGPRTCKSCGFVVLANGTFGVSVDIMRQMYRREAKAEGRRDDAPPNDGPCVQTRGGSDVRHGDKQTDFDTGAKRDTAEGKGRPSLISPVLIHRLGVHLAEGAKHYGDDNWAKGMPYRRTADSMIRHIFQWLAGDTEEDHLSAVCFGAMCLMTYEEQCRDEDGVCDSALDDRCPETAFKHCGCGCYTMQDNGVCQHCKEKRENTTWDSTEELLTCVVCSKSLTCYRRSNGDPECPTCERKRKESLG